MWYKHKKKSIFILLGLGFFGITGLQAQRLYIGAHEEPPRVYYLSDIQTLRFTAGHLSVLTIDGGLDTYAITDVRNLNFRLVPTAIRESTRAISPETFHAYPNPVSEILNIQLTSPLRSDGRLDIYSPEGKLVYSSLIKGNKSEFQINLSGLEKGFYLLRIRSGSVVGTARIIKQ